MRRFEQRSKNGRMRDLILLCDRIFESQPMDYWKSALEAADVPYSVVSNYDDVVADPQLAADDVFVEIDDPELGRVRTALTRRSTSKPIPKSLPLPRRGSASTRARSWRA